MYRMLRPLGLLAAGTFAFLTGSRPVGPEASGVVLAAPRDSVVEAAEQAIDAGRPWRATQMLAPVLSERVGRTPRAVFVAARAAAGWGGWNEVIRLLGTERWLGSEFDGAGDALLARAVVEADRRSLDSVAVFHAARSVTATTDRAARASRLVTLARALERIDLPDSARRTYDAAAMLAPSIADWLLLRAAGLEERPMERRRLLDRVTTDVARARVGWVEAASRERFGDLPGAARLLDSLGARVDPLRIRLALVRDASERASIRHDLGEIVRTRRGSALAREATDVLDDTFAPLTPAEQLLIARSAAQSGPVTRAVHGFAAAFAKGLGDGSDRYAYGRLLERLGRHKEAIAQFTRAEKSSAVAGRARYQRARSMLRSGRLEDCREELRAIIRTPRDRAGAPSALFLLADLATDEGRDSAARSAFLELARKYPSSSLAPRAAFRAAIIAYAAGNTTQAAREFDTIASRFARSSERTAATYWAGRAWERAGNSTVAHARWRTVLERDPRGYYAMLARARVGGAVTPLPVGTVGSDTSIQAAMTRAGMLEQVGLDAEARREYDTIERTSRGSIDAMRTAAAGFRARGFGGRTIRLASEAIRRTAEPDSALYRLLYPLAYRETIEFESAAHDLDPALVAGLIRQESSFSPSARSGAGARGLMQIMPAVGRRSAIAKAAGVWSDELLYQPDVSLRLGTAHLAGLVDRYPDLGRALAAYNAGESRVERWNRKSGTSDAELFVERIPYVETRDYVRIVLRNAYLYRHLYGLSHGGKGRGTV